ncbi:hypothetical protein [Infirmifilum sp. SLHALR2]
MRTVQDSLSERPVIEVSIEDSDILEALKKLGVKRMAVFDSESITYAYPEKADVADLRSFASSALAIIGAAEPWLALKQGSRAVIIYKVSEKTVVIEGEFNPADYDAVVMLSRLLVK